MTADNGEATDEASALSPCVFYLHMGEDSMETLRYGSRHTPNKASLSPADYGGATV